MRLLIIEDEASIMDRLVRLSRNILGSRIQSLDTATSLSAARASIESVEFDLLLLDLNLNGKDGFDLLRDLASRPFHTIVVSAYTQRAIEAYDLGVIDFVPKPFDEERLARAFDRILSSNTHKDHFAKFLAVRRAGKIELVALDEIESIAADGPCSIITKTDGSTHRHDKLLKDIEQLLPPHFDRVHKSYLANMNAVAALENAGNHRHSLRFHSTRQIPLSRPKAKELRNHLKKASSTRFEPVATIQNCSRDR